ncbi:MAG: hypothetical protein KC731_22540 [Myxococcales bacterium]|nr:hypothetical protein [Myxococcales bacterium]
MSRIHRQSFAVRLRDVLSTLEATALIGSVEGRMRGLGEQLVFATLALPCDEALVALELQSLGRLTVPGVASAEGFRAVDHDFLPSGTPFAFLLGGGGGHAVELAEDDELMASLRPVLATTPSHALFVPLALGGSPIGGAALLRAEPFDDHALAMAERLAEVLALTVEAHRTERVLLQLFGAALPDLCGPDAPTDFAARLAELVHELRLEPSYRRSLALAEAVGRVARHGPAESDLAAEILASVGRYVSAMERGDEVVELEDAVPAMDDLFDEP